MLEATTVGTVKPMLNTMPKSKTVRTGLRSISRMHVKDLDSLGCGFILHKFPQTIKRPTMQSRTHFFARFYSIPNIFQIFENNGRTSIALRFRDNLLGYTMVLMANRTLFSARDFSQALFCGLRTVALKAFPMCQELISFFFQRSSTIQFSSGGGCQNIFSQVHRDCLICLHKRRIWKVQYQMEKPALSFPNQLSFLNFSFVQKTFVKQTNLKSNADPLVQSKKRKGFSFKRICSFIEMDRTSVFKQNFSGFFQSLQTPGCFCNSIAAHLRAKLRELLSQKIVGQMVQSNSVMLFFSQTYLSNFITGSRKYFLQIKQSLIFLCRKPQFYCYCPFHTGNYMLLKDLILTKRERHFLPAMNGWVSMPSNG